MTVPRKRFSSLVINKGKLIGQNLLVAKCVEGERRRNEFSQDTDYTRYSIMDQRLLGGE